MISDSWICDGEANQTPDATEFTVNNTTISSITTIKIHKNSDNTDYNTMFTALNSYSNFNVVIFDFNNIDYRIFDVTASSYSANVMTLTVTFVLATAGAQSSFTTGFASQKIVFVPDLFFGASGFSGFSSVSGFSGRRRCSSRCRRCSPGRLS